VLRVWSLVAWFDLCSLGLLSPFVPWFLPSGRPWLDGSSRRRAVSRVSVNPSRRRRVGVESSTLGQAFRSERPSGGGWSPKRALRSERWAEVVDKRALPLGPDLPVGDWTALSACCSRPLGRPMSCVLSVWAEPLRGSQSPRTPGL